MNDYFNHDDNVIPSGVRALESQVNNIAQEVSTGLDRLPTEVELKEGRTRYGVDIGAADAYVVTLPYTPTLTDGFSFYMKAVNANTGAATINVNGLGIKAIVNNDGTALVAGAVGNNAIIQLAYEISGDHFILISQNPGFSGQAADSAVAAAASESAAATSASNASTSATNAGISASAALASEGNALTHANSAASSFDLLDDRYLGDKASDPTLDNDGQALQDGALYWATNENRLKVYDSGNTVWRPFPQPAGADTQIQFNDDGELAGSINLIFDVNATIVQQMQILPVIALTGNLFEISALTGRALNIATSDGTRALPLVDLSDLGGSPDTVALRLEGDVELAGTSRLRGNFINWISVAQVGADLNMATVGVPALTALNGTDVAFIDSTNRDLQKYRFNGSDWLMLGNGLNIAATGAPILAAINGTDVAFADSVNSELRTYRFDGNNWSQVGNGLSISPTSGSSITALNGTDVAIIESLTDDLRVYRFDGADWTQIGNDLFVSGAGITALTALNGTDVAFIDSNNEDLRTYRFDGTDWSQVGNDLNISGAVFPALTAINGTDVAFIDDNDRNLRVYRFDGTDWFQVGSDLLIVGATTSALTALNGTDVAFIDLNNKDLRTYRFSFSIGAGPHLLP